jgi:hypothetical protein
MKLDHVLPELTFRPGQPDSGPPSLLSITLTGTPLLPSTNTPDLLLTMLESRCVPHDGTAADYDSCKQLDVFYLEESLEIDDKVLLDRLDQMVDDGLDFLNGY